jgi:hypothetical protein
VRLWDLGQRAQVATLEGHTNWVMSLAPLEGGLLASGSMDKTVRLWDLSSLLATRRGGESAASHTQLAEATAASDEREGSARAAYREPQREEQSHTPHAPQERRSGESEAAIVRHLDDIEAKYRARVAQLDAWLAEQSQQGEAAHRQAMAAVEATLRREFEQHFTHLHTELSGHINSSIETLLSHVSGSSHSHHAHLELAQQVQDSLTRMCLLEQRIAVNELSLANHADVLGRLDAAFGDEADKKIAYTAFRQELQDFPLRSAFFVAFVARFGAQLESIKLFYGGLLERAKTKGEGKFETVAALAEQIPLLGAAAKGVVHGLRRATASRQQDRRLAAPIGSLALLEGGSQQVAQEVGYAIVTTFAKEIDRLGSDMPDRRRKDAKKKQAYIERAVGKCAGTVTQHLFDHITKKRLTDEPLADQLIEVIELAQTEIFGVQQRAVVESGVSRSTRNQVVHVGRSQQAAEERLERIERQMTTVVNQMSDVIRRIEEIEVLVARLMERRNS